MERTVNLPALLAAELDEAVPARRQLSDSERSDQRVLLSWRGSEARGPVTLIIEVAEGGASAHQLAGKIESWLSHESRLTAISTRAGSDVDHVLDLLERASSPPTESGLTAADIVALESANIELPGAAEATLEGVLRGGAAAKRLTDTALSVEQAARELGVTPGRVRQRITEGELAATRRADGYLLPGWQFERGELVPGLKVVLHAAADIHPLTLQRFMTRPSVDLEIDGKSASPRAWLISGGDARAVVELAAGLGVPS